MFTGFSIKGQKFTINRSHSNIFGGGGGGRLNPGKIFSNKEKIIFFTRS